MSHELAIFFLFLLLNDKLGAIRHSTVFVICRMSWLFFFLFLLLNDKLGAIRHSTVFVICRMSWLFFFFFFAAK